MSLGRLVTIMVLAGFAAAPAAGAANVICVHVATSCPAGTDIDEGSDLQAALDDAGTSPGSTVTIQPGGYNRTAGFSYDHPGAVTITGTDAAQVTLQASGSGVSVLTVHGPSSVSGLTLQVQASAGRGLDLAVGATASHLIIETTVQGNGAELQGATLDDSVVRANDNAIVNMSGTSFVHRVDLTGAAALYVGGGSLTAADVTANAVNAIAVAFGGGTLTIDGLLGRYTGPPTGEFLHVLGGDLTVRSGTLVAATVEEAAAVVAGNGETASLTLLDSIVTGAATSYLRDASGTGTADLTFGHDRIDLSQHGPDAGSGTVTPGTGNITADPLFRDPAGDFRLRFGSPAIDSGGACQAICQSTPDLDGRTRPIDGDGDGTATRDMGAYEYARQPPTAVAATDRATALTGEAVGFSASGSADPDGDALAYHWVFDDGSAGDGDTVTHAFAVPGAHSASLTVSDPSGLTATATAAVTVQAPPPPPPVRDTTPPVLSALKLSSTSFAVAKGRTAVSARHVHHGTTIGFRLSERAKVVATISLRSCRTRHRHVTCSYKKAGSLTRRSEPARSDHISFTGRLGTKALKRGSYHLSLVATDAAGNHSRARQVSFKVVSG
jgi:hypothetical protein